MTFDKMYKVCRNVLFSNTPSGFVHGQSVVGFVTNLRAFFVESEIVQSVMVL